MDEYRIRIRRRAHGRGKVPPRAENPEDMEQIFLPFDFGRQTRQGDGDAQGNDIGMFRRGKNASAPVRKGRRAGK